MILTFHNASPLFTCWIMSSKYSLDRGSTAKIVPCWNSLKINDTKNKFTIVFMMSYETNMYKAKEVSFEENHILMIKFVSNINYYSYLICNITQDFQVGTLLKIFTKQIVKRFYKNIINVGYITMVGFSLELKVLLLQKEC